MTALITFISFTPTANCRFFSVMTVDEGLETRISDVIKSEKYSPGRTSCEYYTFVKPPSHQITVKHCWL